LLFLVLGFVSSEIGRQHHLITYPASDPQKVAIFFSNVSVLLDVVLGKLVRPDLLGANKAVEFGRRPDGLSRVLIYNVSFERTGMEALATDFTLRANVVLFNHMGLQLEFEDALAAHLALGLVVIGMLLVFVLQQRGRQELFPTDLASYFRRATSLCLLRLVRRSRLTGEPLI